MGANDSCACVHRLRPTGGLTLAKTIRQLAYKYRNLGLQNYIKCNTGYEFCKFLAFKVSNKGLLEYYRNDINTET